VATTMNGKPRSEHGSGSVAQQLLALTGAYRDRGLSFRYNPHSKNEELRWQAGRSVTDAVTAADGSVQLVERWELVGWGRSANELVAQLT
jgi:hypothetical protein